MKKILFILTVAITFTSCSTPGVERIVTENKNVTVDLMCTVEGRNVYRMYDGSREVYFVINPNSTTTAWQEQVDETTVNRTVTAE
jgi:hypothetical protein